ncbi:MAG: Rieske 2Fe-2S domain-containing protein [Candidatus Eremiobacteraeota bacterium]|nr:Rieske 2Fe-2S domain-containing protein [Candidatus Eremiobacteraeota bacterium]
MKRQTETVAASLAVTIVCSASFIVTYARDGGRLWEGLSLAGAALGLCAAALAWAFGILTAERVEDRIDEYPSPSHERAAESAELREDAARVSRPFWLFGMLGAALGSFGLALLVPIRSLGPRPDDTLFHTKWKSGIPLVRPDGTPVRADDLNVDSDVVVFPQDAVGDAMSQATLVRVAAGDVPETQGYLVYSRVCTHAGCPVALYRASARELMCPCHQSVFDVMQEGKVLAGPADHALPRLPIEIGDDGILRATGDFPQPVGPSFWERG